MKASFTLPFSINRLFILLISIVLFSCTASKPTVVIRKPVNPNPTPIKEEVIVKTDEEKEETNEKKETVLDDTKNIDVTPSLAYADRVIGFADSYMGTPHRMGGLSKKGIDCSGLVQISYKHINVNLPRSTRDQVNAGKAVSMGSIQKGDLIFFTYPGGKRVTHVGMVHKVNGPQDVVFIHTSSSRGVRKDNLYSNYWKPLFVKARRVI